MDMKINKELRIEDLIDLKIMDIRHEKSGNIVLVYDEGEISIGCSGGNSAHFTSDNYNDAIGSTIIAAGHDDACLITLVFNKMFSKSAHNVILEIEDDTGGEGLEVWKSKCSHKNTQPMNGGVDEKFYI